MSCKSCSGECGSITVPMKPEGDGPILIVLDKIESDQDFNGSYYAGASGKLLTDLIGRAGLTREGCTIMSSSSCLSLRNTAEPGHFNIVSALQYTSIVALGDGAFKSLCGRSGIKDKRGQAFSLKPEFNRPELLVYPTYDLGLVRRVPTYRNIVVADIQRAVSAGKESEKIEWSYWNEVS